MQSVSESALRSLVFSSAILSQRQRPCRRSIKILFVTSQGSRIGICDGICKGRRSSLPDCPPPPLFFSPPFPTSTTRLADPKPKHGVGFTAATTSFIHSEGLQKDRVAVTIVLSGGDQHVHSVTNQTLSSAARFYKPATINGTTDLAGRAQDRRSG